MEPPTPTPEDEFEFYFRKAAKNKHLMQAQLAHDIAPRRGSLPTSIDGKENLPVITIEGNHHHRASSCKTSNKNASKQVRRSPSSRLPSDKRPSSGDVRTVTASGNGFLSPSSGDAAVTSTSAPQSRSGSFRMASARDGGARDSVERDGGGSGSRERRRSSVYLEETVAAKLRELKQIEDDNCLVVREFTMSPKGDIIHRVDSFKKKRDPSPKAPSSTAQQPTGELLRAPNQGLTVPGRPTSLPRLISCERPHRVLVIGDRKVGKTALVTQFMTSEYLAALDTSFDADVTDEKTISVSVDGEEMTLQFTELQPEEQLEHRQLHPEVDCYLLVYSIAVKNSFAYISSLLRDLSQVKREFAVIVVANKSDVVRKRQVKDSDAMDVCTKFSAKFIEVSAALNHKVDELLIGIVSQIRLNPKRRQGGPLLDEPPTPTVVACSKGTRGLLSRLFSRKKKEPRPCENLKTF